MPIVTVTALLGSNPVEGASVEVFDETDALVSSDRTNASGEAAFTLGAGEYHIHAKSPLTGEATPVSVTVASTDLSAELLLVDLGISQPTPASKCKLYGFVVQADDDGLPKYVHVVESPNGQWQVLLSADGSGVNPVNQRVVPTSRLIPIRNGFWHTDVLQGSAVKVYFPNLGVSKIFLVPNGSTALAFEDTVSLVSNSEMGLVGDTTIAGSVGGASSTFSP